MQLEAIPSCPITCYMAEETEPHLAAPSFLVAAESTAQEAECAVVEKAELLCWRVLGQYCKRLSMERETKTRNSLHKKTGKFRPVFGVDWKK